MSNEVRLERSRLNALEATNRALTKYLKVPVCCVNNGDYLNIRAFRWGEVLQVRISGRLWAPTLRRMESDVELHPSHPGAEEKDWRVGQVFIRLDGYPDFSYMGDDLTM